ncbi:MAG: phosphatase PAP2 family protein [Paenibacillaceae bacterium]
MFYIQSMTHVTVFIAITVFFILLFALRTNPIAVAGTFVQEIFSSRKYFFHLAAMIFILFINKIQLYIEKQIKNPDDFTPSIFKFEGNIVASIQHFFQNDILTTLLTFFYVVVFTSLLVASLFKYTHSKDKTLFYALCYAMMINYMVAIPFYFFFPVNEVWFFHPQVDLLILDVFPSFEQEYRPLSGLNNCFPSLHTSISVTLALIALRSTNKFWRRFVTICAGIIIFSIFYLGIHWVTDMAGGMVLGIIASQVGLRVSEGSRVYEGKLQVSVNRVNKRDLKY